jgi:hypothetical protein
MTKLQVLKRAVLEGKEMFVSRKDEVNSAEYCHVQG